MQVTAVFTRIPESSNCFFFDLIPTNDLNDWNPSAPLRPGSAQRWNVWNPLQHQVSGAIERLESTR
jgi:hypothetical protein